MHNKTFFVIIIVLLLPLSIVILTAAKRGFVYRDPFTELTTTNNQDCPANTFTYEVKQLLEKNSIDLSRLKAINPEGNPLLEYSSEPTGFSYSLVSHEMETGGVENGQRLILRACYNDRQVLTRSIRMSFTMSGVLRGAYDFDFSPIDVNPLPSLSEGAARTAAYRSQPSLEGVKPALGYYDLNAGTGNAKPNYILAWQFERGARVVVNAHTAEIVRSSDGIAE